MSDLAAALAKAEALGTVGREQQALELLLEHAQQGWQHPEWLIALAKAQCRLGRLDEAARAADAALQLAPQAPEPLHLRGTIALAAGRPEQALEDANRAVALCPESPSGHLLAAHALLSMPGRLPGPDADRAIDAAERLGTDASQIAMLRAKMWVGRGRLPEARRHTDAGLAEAPTSRPLRQLKAVLAKPGAKGGLEAGELLRGLLAEAPTDAEARQELTSRYLERLRPTPLLVLAVYAASSVLLMLPAPAPALCALGGAVLLPWLFLRRRRQAIRLVGQHAHTEDMRAFPGLAAYGPLMLAASVTALVPLASTPFLPAERAAQTLASIAMSSALAGVCLAWSAQLLIGRGLPRFAYERAHGRAPGPEEVHRARIAHFFWGTVKLRLFAATAAICALLLSTTFPPGLSMLAMFAGPSAWLCSWSVHGMLIRERRRQRRGATPALEFPRELSATAQTVVAILMMLLWSYLCFVCLAFGTFVFSYDHG